MVSPSTNGAPPPSGLIPRCVGGGGLLENMVALLEGAPGERYDTWAMGEVSGVGVGFCRARMTPYQ